jgi:hypothetical protein
LGCSELGLFIITLMYNFRTNVSYIDPIYNKKYNEVLI